MELKKKDFKVRQMRLTNKIQRAVTKILIEDTAHHPIVNSKNVNVSSVSLTDDLMTARVYWSPSTFSEHDEKVIKEHLNMAEGKLRHFLTKRVQTRFIPRLAFIKKDNLQKVEQLLDVIENEEKSKN